ncbi:MAG: hypothetical protein AB1410_08115 [Acidobacteriota bacterium]
MGFNEIPGNEIIKKILRNSLREERLPHSIMFYGSSVRNLVAKVLSKALNCEVQGDDSCENCRNCRLIEKDVHPDIITLKPEGTFIKIDQIRFLIEISYLKPMIGRQRVFIISNAENLNEESSNALLKVLEEPSSFTKIILLSENPVSVIPTIQSRCFKFFISKLKKEEWLKFMKVKNYSEDETKLLYQIFEGDIEEALNVDLGFFKERRNKVFEIIKSMIYKENIIEYINEMNNMIVKNKKSESREEFKDLLKIVSIFFRDIIYLNDSKSDDLLINNDFKNELLDLKVKLKNKNLFDYIDRIEEMISAISKNVNLDLALNSFIGMFLEGEKEYV